MLEKARLAVRKRQTRRRRQEAAARYEGESVYGCSSVPLHGGSELGVPSQISTAGSSHVFHPLWSKEKVPMPDEPDSMAKPIHFPQEFSSKQFKYGSTYTAKWQYAEMGQQPTSFCGQIPKSIRGGRRASFQEESPPKLSVSWGKVQVQQSFVSFLCQFTEKALRENSWETSWKSGTKFERKQPTTGTKINWLAKENWRGTLLLDPLQAGSPWQDWRGKAESLSQG